MRWIDIILDQRQTGFLSGVILDALEIQWLHLIWNKFKELKYTSLAVRTIPSETGKTRHLWSVEQSLWFEKLDFFILWHFHSEWPDHINSRTCPKQTPRLGSYGIFYQGLSKEVYSIPRGNITFVEPMFALPCQYIAPPVGAICQIVGTTIKRANRLSDKQSSCSV